MERKALGRGLASLIPENLSRETRPSTSTEERVGIRWLPIGEIVATPLQPRKRFDENRIQELAQSIREKGVLAPLIVSEGDGRYELVSGERRLRAARVAGLTEVPVIVRSVEPSERLELALVENIQRQDLDPIEEASAYQVLLERFGYTQEQLADRVGRDRATIANLLRLLKLSSPVKQSLQVGEITVGHARTLLGVPEMERQLYFLKRVVQEGWSVRELEARIASDRRTGVRKWERPLSPELIRIVDDLRRSLGTQVRLIPSTGRPKDERDRRPGKILIEYYSEDDLDRIYRIIVRES